MKKIVESELYKTYLKLANGLIPVIIFTGYAWLENRLSNTFVTRQEMTAIEEQRDLKTQIMLKDMTQKMALLGQSVASLEKTIERKNP